MLSTKINMKKQILLTGLILGLIVILLGVIVSGSRKNIPTVTPTPSLAPTGVSQDKVIDKPIFYYGNTCPHCAEVEIWMTENDVEKKIMVLKKEVYDNQQNAQELAQTAVKCGLPTNSIGVPFLYAEGKCFIGSPDVINYLSKKAGLK